MTNNELESLLKSNLNGEWAVSIIGHHYSDQVGSEGKEYQWRVCGSSEEYGVFNIVGTDTIELNEDVILHIAKQINWEMTYA